MTHVLMISIPEVGLTKIKNKINEFFSSSNDLLFMIEVNLSQQKVIDDDIDIFIIILISFLVASSRGQQDSDEDLIDSASTFGSEAQVFVRSVWRISLLYWATHCAVRSVEIQQFRSRLEIEEASLKEPFLIELLTTKYKSMKMKRIVSKTLSSEERTRFTSVWMQTFPTSSYPSFLEQSTPFSQYFRMKVFFAMASLSAPTSLFASVTFSTTS